MTFEKPALGNAGKFIGYNPRRRRHHIRLMVVIGIALTVLIIGRAFAQQTLDPRICAAQLNSAESDGGNMLKLIHSLGAQNDILKIDLAAAQKQLADEKAKSEPKVEKK